MQDMLLRIRQGVNLKPVSSAADEEKGGSKPGSADSGKEKVTLDFNSALQARFKKMNIINDDSDSDDSQEW